MSDDVRERVAAVLKSYRDPAAIGPAERQRILDEHIDRLLASLGHPEGRASIAMQDDMAELMTALGISTHARDASPHQVMQNEIIPAVKALCGHPEGQEPVGYLVNSEHPYYCEMQNYYSNEAFTQFEGWAAFLDAMGESDPDLNYVFRWDWNDDLLDLAIMHQRKGRYWPVVVRGMKPEDEPSVRAWLEKRWLTVLANWAPVGRSLASPVASPEGQESETECPSCGHTLGVYTDGGRVVAVLDLGTEGRG